MQEVQSADPVISLVRGDSGEVTLFIDDVQAMQGWEHDLMCRSADLLTEDGGDFLEVGLGLGISAKRIASRAAVRSHLVVEKYQGVIDLFTSENADVPLALSLVNADFFDFVDTLEADSLDGVFFDPELPKELFENRALLDDFMPKLVKALRPGGRFVPMFAIAGAVPDLATCTTSPGEMLERYLRFFDRVVLESHPYQAYADTEYTPGPSGSAYVLCFQR
jgi:predicted methyltransferase